MLNGKSILVAGGTGEFGQKFIERVLRDYPGVKKLIVYSRSEPAQYQMSRQYPHQQFPQLRFLIGDIRDRERLIRACENVDIFVNAAGFSQVGTAEYNPDECVKTTVYGAQNVIDAAIACGIKSVVAISSGKACAPVTLFGAAKLLADKLYVAANNIVGGHGIRFSVVRFGNVIGSRGSVFPYFLERRRMGAKELPITDPRMTRFNATMQIGVETVLFAIANQLGGEIFIPKCPSYHITDVAEAIAPNLPQKVVGIRPGEKLHETLIARDDSVNTLELDRYYVIVPPLAFTGNRNLESYLAHYNARRVPEGFKYSSDENPEWETVDTLRAKIRQYVDPGFKPQ